MAREHPCCLCPAVNEKFKKNVCPRCDFKVKFVDDRGWTYFVQAGIGGEAYKTFYRKQGKRGAHASRMTEWRDSFVTAQIELNQLAKKKGWKEKLNVVIGNVYENPELLEG